jgi:hypothetical protein
MVVTGRAIDSHIAEAIGQAVRDAECGGAEEFCNVAGTKREGKFCACEGTAKAVIETLEKVRA